MNPAVAGASVGAKRRPMLICANSQDMTMTVPPATLAGPLRV